MTETIGTAGIDSLPPHMLNAAVAVAVSVGTLYCFLGYRTIKTIIAMTGFLLAGASAGAIVGFIADGRLLYMLPAAALGGLCGAVALLAAYRCGVFLVGLLGAALTAHYAAEFWPLLDSPWAALGVGVVGGLVALVIERPVVTMATAALGAWAIVNGVLFFLVTPAGGAPPILPTLDDEHRTVLLVWFVLTVAGAVAQFATYRKPRRQEK